MRVRRGHLLGIVAATVVAGAATAAIVYTSNGPFGGFFGLWGPDVSSQQSVGARFTPAPGGADPVWNFASSGTGFSAMTLQDGVTWQAGGSGAGLTLTIEGTPGLPNPADINHDGLVNGLDLAALLSAWGACSGC
ncbi:MAG: hypothetical protein O2855_09265, partial [Planctomycetota bacterium]|nr:hypothetical protein [Planctomycetota bacterium]